MAIYFQFSDGDQVQVATNSGWGDLCRLIAEKSNEDSLLRQLASEGWAEPVNEVSDELRGLSSDDESIERTITGAIDILHMHGDQDDAIVVTDGMSSDTDA